MIIYLRLSNEKSPDYQGTSLLSNHQRQDDYLQPLQFFAVRLVILANLEGSSVLKTDRESEQPRKRLGVPLAPVYNEPRCDQAKSQEETR